jgi:hypothetical protein
MVIILAEKKKNEENWDRKKWKENDLKKKGETLNQ